MSFPPCRCSRRRWTAGQRQLFAIGRYLDTVKVDGTTPRFKKRVVKLETRQFGFGNHIPF